MLKCSVSRLTNCSQLVRGSDCRVKELEYYKVSAMLMFLEIKSLFYIWKRSDQSIKL